MSRFFLPVTENDHVEGRPTAAATLIEYGDYQCPYCGEAYSFLKQVVRVMGDRMRFVFRNFPLTEIHPNALPAAQFAEATASIGKFWPAHDLPYENQEALREGDLYAYAPRIGLPRPLLTEALAGRFDDKIDNDFSAGVRGGVNGTPALFINGSRYDGDRDAESIAEAVKLVILNHAGSELSARRSALISTWPAPTRNRTGGRLL
jgi:protein-disulfide isomerase